MNTSKAKITLVNTFHNTEVNLVVGSADWKNHIGISASQYYRAMRALCGATGCGCGGTYNDPNYGIYADYDLSGDRCYYIAVK